MNGIDICQNKHGGHPCSVAAFESTDRDPVRAEVLHFIASRRELGATADECAVHFGCFHNRTSPRLSELKRDGMIYESGELRETRTGRKAAVCIAYPDLWETSEANG